MQTQYEKLTDLQWEVMKEILPVKRKRKHCLRSICNAIFYILRAGVQWRNIGEGHPNWSIVYYYFRKWKKDNTLERLNTSLNKLERKRKEKAPTPSLLSIDSQSVKCSPFVSEKKGIDGNKMVNGRKRHVITDTLGLVWGVVVGAANEQDGAVAERVIEPLLGYLNRMEKILADQAYKVRFMDWVKENVLGLEVELSSRPPSSEGFVPVKWRWVTERTFGTYNFFRRLDKDREKTTESHEAWLFWQNCQIILNRMAT